MRVRRRSLLACLAVALSPPVWAAREEFGIYQSWGAFRDTAARGCFADSAAFGFRFACVHQRAQKCSGRDDDGAASDRLTGCESDAGNALWVVGGG